MSAVVITGPRNVATLRVKVIALPADYRPHGGPRCAAGRQTPTLGGSGSKAWIGGDHTTSTPEQSPSDDFVSTEELARRQGVKPITSVDDLAAEVDPIEFNEEYEAFLADLYAPRRAGLG